MRWLDGITDSIDNEFEQALGDGERQGSLACCSPGGHKESEMTEKLNKNNNKNICQHLEGAHNSVKYYFGNDHYVMLHGHLWVKDVFKV